MRVLLRLADAWRSSCLPRRSKQSNPRSHHAYSLNHVRDISVRTHGYMMLCNGLLPMSHKLQAFWHSFTASKYYTRSSTTTSKVLMTLTSSRYPRSPLPMSAMWPSPLAHLHAVRARIQPRRHSRVQPLLTVSLPSDSKRISFRIARNSTMTDLVDSTFTKPGHCG